MQMTVYSPRPNGSGAFQLSGVYFFVSLAAKMQQKNSDPMERTHGIKNLKFWKLRFVYER